MKNKLSYLKRRGPKQVNPRLKKRKAKNDSKRFQKAVDIAYTHYMNGLHDWATRKAKRDATHQEQVLEDLQTEAQKHDLGY